MTTTATLYEAADVPLAAVIDAVPTARWTDPSPCEGWSAREVLRHLIETQRDFLARFEVDLGPAPDIEADPADAWRGHAKRFVEAISDATLTSKEYVSHFGATTVGATLEHFYVFDMVVHRWDIATAVGVEAGLTDDEVNRLEAGAESFGEALYMDGVCKPGVEAPAGADRTQRLLAKLGRRGQEPTGDVRGGL